MVTVEQVNQSAEHLLSQFRIDHALGLADRYAQRGGSAVILRTRKLIPADSSQTSLVGTVTVSKVNVAPTELADDKLFQTLLAARLYHFVPVVQEAIKKRIDPQCFLTDNGDYALRPVERYGEWLHQEFETELCAEAALNLFEAVFKADITAEHRAPCLPRAWQIAIGSIRLARRMTSWTLEGEAFRCSVLLMSRERFAAFMGNRGSTLTRILNFEEPVPFHLGNQKEVRSMAELAQADDLFLIVNASDGCLHVIAGPNYEGGRLNESRHLRYARLANDNAGLLLHVRDGFVEVYGAERLWLWHDRFRWEVKPFETLRQALEHHFPPGGNREERINMMIGAIASLMDRHQASIIVLLHDEDVESFERATNPLRIGLGESSDRNAERGDLPINRLALETLTSILHIDGAHAIRHDGTLSHLARRIKISQEPPATDSSGKAWDRSFDREFPGTGTGAARDLSDRLTASCVIKVSASGYIKFFDYQHRYESHRASAMT